MIAHNIRSVHNVGSILRTADGFGTDKVFFTGYTPYPRQDNETRLPHNVDRIDSQISKTALGAEKTVDWEARPNILSLIRELRNKGFAIASLEQNPKSLNLERFKSNANVALVLGSEVEGTENNILKEVDFILEIPMSGTKESFNVGVSCGIALYHLKHIA